MEYLYPESVEQAIQLLKSGDGANRIIAGGTDVLPDIRRGKIAPDCLVDITRIPELDQIQIQERMIQVGAAVTFAAIQRSRKEFQSPMLWRLIPSESKSLQRSYPAGTGTAISACAACR